MGAGMVGHAASRQVGEVGAMRRRVHTETDVLYIFNV